MLNRCCSRDPDAHGCRQCATARNLRWGLGGSRGGCAILCLVNGRSRCRRCSRLHEHCRGRWSTGHHGQRSYRNLQARHKHSRRGSIVSSEDKSSLGVRLRVRSWNLQACRKRGKFERAWWRFQQAHACRSLHQDIAARILLRCAILCLVHGRSRCRRCSRLQEHSP